MFALLLILSHGSLIFAHDKLDAASARYTVGRAPSRITFTSVPESCEQNLVDLDAQTDRRVLPEAIDWAEWTTDLINLGYTATEAKRIMRLAGADATSLIGLIRRALGKPRWTWDRPLTRADSALIGANWSFDLRELPVWAALRGFNVGAAVQAYIAARPALSTVDRVRLADTATFWVNGPTALKSALTYLEHRGFTGWHPSIAWMQARLDQADRRAFLKRVVQRAIDGKLTESSEAQYMYLGLTPNLNADELPDATARVMRERWINLERFPPLKTGRVRVAFTGVTPAGDCEQMAFGHFRTLFPGHFGDFGFEGDPMATVIRIGDQVIGVIKPAVPNISEPSFLALRNVVNDDGRLILALGGVYEVHYTARAKQRGPGVDVSSLRVRALSFLLNNERWVGRNQTALRKIIAPHATLGPDAFAFQHGAVQPAVWFGLLEALERRRLEIEANGPR